jgi:hypothetical protein
VRYATFAVCDRQSCPTRTPPDSVPTDGIWSDMWCPIWPSDGRHLGGYAGGYRIPQLYPPARRQIPPQIQGASRSLGERNQPRLAPRGPPLGLPISPSVPDSIFRRFIVPSQIATHHGFQPDDVVASLGGLLRWSRLDCAPVSLCTQEPPQAIFMRPQVTSRPAIK